MLLLLVKRRWRSHRTTSVTWCDHILIAHWGRGMAKGLGAERIRELARAGAEAVLKNLRAEIIAIERTFPELALPAKRRAVRKTVRNVHREGRTMSAAARKDVSDRMTKYGPERRKAKARVKENARLRPIMRAHPRRWS